MHCVQLQKELLTSSGKKDIPPRLISAGVWTSYQSISNGYDNVTRWKNENYYNL